MQNEQKAIRRSLDVIMWSMRGSVSREEAYTLSPIERESYNELIEERMQLVEKTKLPLI